MEEVEKETVYGPTGSADTSGEVKNVILKLPVILLAEHLSAKSRNRWLTFLLAKNDRADASNHGGAISCRCDIDSSQEFVTEDVVCCEICGNGAFEVRRRYYRIIGRHHGAGYH